jgi:uncharacterized RDD family membrane protein YckC
MTRIPASFWRRLGAMVYDSLILLGVLFLAGIPLVFIEDSVRTGFWVQSVIRGYLLLACFAYFAASWRRGGQTVGMRAWGLRLLDDSGSRPSWRAVSIRFVMCLISWLPLGAGYLWILLDSRRRALHDIASGTRIYHERT